MSFDENNPYQPHLSTGSYGGNTPAPMAQGKVNGPAIGLIVTAILGFLGQGAGLVMNLAGIGAGAGAVPENIPPEQAQMFEMINSVSGGIGIVGSLIGLAVGVVILLGALKMKSLTSYGFAMASAVLAMIPCVSPCCLVGLPIGIWAVVVLNDPAVKSAFR
ncbi:MAG TPA: hypothetical protein PLF81_28445 [Candidatus Anammoximicrobium sp.]|nr:hypothetical protein [Candidatus Anammoximicrobium sp.]